MAPLGLLSKHNEGDDIDWDIYVKLCTMEDLINLLGINTHMEEFEICAIIQKEIDYRKQENQ